MVAQVERNLTGDPPPLRRQSRNEVNRALDETADALLPQLKAGSQEAFGQFYETFQPHCVRVARIFTPTQSLAEDVVGLTFLQLFQSMENGGFQRVRALRHYLVQAVVNRAKTTVAREDRSSSLTDLEDRKSTSDIELSERKAMKSSFDYSFLPEDYVVQAECIGAISRALEQLPPGQRSVVYLSCIEGLDNDQIVGVLGTTAGNVRVLLSRGRARLRQALESEPVLLDEISTRSNKHHAKTEYGRTHRKIKNKPESII